MNIIDSHAHLDDPRFDYDRDDVINNFMEDGITCIINPSSDLESSRASFELAKMYEDIYACLGTHPHEAKYYNDSVEEEYRKMAKFDKVVGIGEIGLDYHYDYSPRDVQKEVFIRQIKLARELNLPIVIHSRDAANDTYDILEEYARGMKVMLHAFSEDLDFMDKYIKLGYYISLGGLVTFKNASKTREVGKNVPLDRLLLETDSPYLTPEPFRGRRNQPKYIKYIAKKIGELKGMKGREIIDIGHKNAKEFFNLPIE